jgi:hypothetical protein
MAKTKTEASELEANAKKVVADFLAGNKTYQSSGLAGQLINPGFVGKVELIDLVALTGANITPRTPQQGPQIMNGITVAEVGDPSKVMSLVFEGGRSVALATLNNHPGSTIDGAPWTDFSDYGSLIGKTLKCIDRIADTDRMNSRRIAQADGSFALQTNPMQKYTFATQG